MRTITVQLPDEVALKLAAEASMRHLTLEELACERLSQTSLLGAESSRPTNYVKLAEKASKAPSARKSIEEIDGDIEAARNEW